MSGLGPRCALLVVGAILASSAIASASAGGHGRDLPQSPNWHVGHFVAIAPRITYQARLVVPTPTIRATDADWQGTQIVTTHAGRPRYESAVFLGHQGEVDLVTGPGSILSPKAAIDAQLQHVAHWQFAPGDAPTAIQRSTVAGRSAIFFEATDPGPGPWTLVGSNPPELQVEPGESFRMSAFAVRGRTVVVVVRAQKASFADLRAAAMRLLSSLAFPSG